MSKWNDSPMLRVALAACPALAVATTAMNGLALGIATGCVLVLAGLVAAVLGKLVDDKGRLALFMVVSAVFAGMAQMILKAICADTAASLGIYVPMIALNCVLLTRLDEQGVGSTVAEDIKLAIAFICTVTVLGALRELCDVGCVFGAQLLPKGTQLSAMAALPAGGLMLLGLLAGVANAIKGKGSRKEDEAA